MIILYFQRSFVFLSQERNSLTIAREELEHELDSKNHTIRMLQKQLVSELLSKLIIKLNMQFGF